MKKSFGLLVAILIISLQVSCAPPKPKEEEKQPVIKPQESDLPKINLTNLDGSKVSAKALLGNKTILILFQPDCEHCQNETKQIKERLASFSQYQVYYISSAALPDIKKFSEDYGLSTQKNFHFASTTVQDVIDSYGPIPAPSIYIYSAEGKLLNNFNGEMEIDVVIKYL